MIKRCVEWLNLLCRECGIHVVECNDLPSDAPSICYDEVKLILFNKNSTASHAFMLAHEMAHILIEDAKATYHTSDAHRLKCEAAADKYALELILAFCLKEEISFTNVDHFCISFGLLLEHVGIFYEKICSVCNNPIELKLA